MSTITKDLIVCGVKAENAEDAIKTIGAYLINGGYVKDTYLPAVLERETEYPTGLQLKTIGVAMPHTAGIHVNIPAVCVAKLSDPVEFRHMGDPDTKVQAQLIFMMAIKDPDAQLDTHQKVMRVFTNEEAVEELSAASDKDKLYEAAMKYMG
ncbi:MAG: PTS sugar transporter subunit IIA [Clostridiales bacterium]|nr:PTS sugar transporter subunit IIA [Clostridiales bacterium]